MILTNHAMGVTVCRAKTTTTPPFPEKSYYRQLTREGTSLGLHVFVFCPLDIDWKTRRVKAWQCNPNTGRWSSQQHSLPPLIYDRCYYRNTKEYLIYKPAVSALKNDASITFLGRPLGGKLSTQEMLMKNPDIVPYLPPTIEIVSTETVHDFIKRYPTVLIKPNGGSHGRGVASISTDQTHYYIKGRTATNRSFYLKTSSKSTLNQWLIRFIEKTRYIIQPYLLLETKDQRPFDLRILVQKNERSIWRTTGMAIRTGTMGSLTSNLHGGGAAQKALPFIQHHFPKQFSHILTSIEFLAKEIPQQIEREHGRLLELGIDLGIDQSGEIWFLEANSKPGRSVFILTGEKEVRVLSVRRPMLYAQSLVQGLIGGS